MTKDELKSFIQNLNLEEKFSQIILGIVEDSQSITPQLLTGLADILESYAEYQNKLAEAYEAMANELGSLTSQLQELGEKELEQRTQILTSAQEQAAARLNSRIEELKNK